MANPAEHPAGETPAPARPDWRAEYAYTAGMQAFIYGFPYIYNAQTAARLGDRADGTRP